MQDTSRSLAVFHNGLLCGTTTYLGASGAGSLFTPVP